MAQIKARHIPYKGSAPAMTDVINGQVSYTVETVASVVGHVRSGRLKTFGVTTARRAGGMPDVPTLAEAADLKDLDIGAWIGYAAPSGVPREIVLRLSNEMHKALQESALKEKLLAAGLDPAPIPLEQLPAFMRAEQERYASVIKNANIRLE
jgi:tripartite-type tricarboxylate transporter receptor subunit TctC